MMSLPLFENIAHVCHHIPHSNKFAMKVSPNRYGDDYYGPLTWSQGNQIRLSSLPLCNANTSIIQTRSSARPYGVHMQRSSGMTKIYFIFLLFALKFVGTTQSGDVEVLNLTRTTQGRIGLLIREGEDQKIYVEDVVPGEPAATQGDLRQGDRILEACI